MIGGDARGNVNAPGANVMIMDDGSGQGHHGGVMGGGMGGGHPGMHHKGGVMHHTAMAESATSAAAAAPLPQSLPSLKAPEGEDIERVGRVSIAGHSPKTWLMSSVDTNGITIAVQWHGKTKTLSNPGDPWGHSTGQSSDLVSDVDVAVTLERFEVEQNFVRTPSQSLTDKFKAIPLVSLQPSRGYFFELISLKPRNASRITFKNNHNGHQNRLIVRLTYTLILRGRGIGITQSIATNLVEVHTKNRYIGSDEMSRFRRDYMANLATIKKTCEGVNRNIPVKVTSYLAGLFAAEDELWQAYCKSRAKQKHVKARELNRKTRKRAMIVSSNTITNSSSTRSITNNNRNTTIFSTTNTSNSNTIINNNTTISTSTSSSNTTTCNNTTINSSSNNNNNNIVSTTSIMPPRDKSPDVSIMSTAHGAALSLPVLTEFSEKFTNTMEEMSMKLNGLDRRMQHALGRLAYLEENLEHGKAKRVRT
ncbi:Hypothetical Protein FCC1311_079202 [Hondaea fermentalgiana]|uniref:Uncharacterized protein n=1 Tax=Hondaea fermentalgiana TaxID=2315210 RepID=A0A2R5GM41_9STRA|nr:Hypothetical Protein FCC1311_079202 [Hondaea fermentalgiana]|eukprot:GBG31695.1 Hypothetical Protein FCC1311_079202 [Hondaea fermentalgiana]